MEKNRHLSMGKNIHGCVWKCCVALNPMVLLIIIPSWKIAISLGIYPIFRQTQMVFNVVKHGKSYSSPTLSKSYINPTFSGPNPLVAYSSPSSSPRLHALELSLQHPSTAERLTFRAPLPEDMRQLIRRSLVESHAAKSRKMAREKWWKMMETD